MDRSLDQLYQMALALTLWIAGLGLGMSFGPRQILRTLRRGGLFARATVLDVVIVPLLVWGLVQAFSIPDHYATGLLLVGVATAGPLGIKAAQLARADLPYAIALVVVLEVANAVAIPVWVALLMPPWVQVPIWPVVRTLLLLVLAPLAVGMAVRAAAANSGAPGAVGGAAVDDRAAGGDRHRAGKVCPHRPGQLRGGGPGSVDGRAAGATAGRASPTDHGHDLAGDRGTGQRSRVGDRANVVRGAFRGECGHRGFRDASILLPVSFAIVAGRTVLSDTSSPTV